jgi:homoaconitase/3-isopropylmalate dehydratase large subunit
MTEKIFAAHAREGRAGAGEIVSLTPDILLLNDISGPVAFQQFDNMGATRPFDPARVVLVADHFSPAKDVLTAESIKILRAFADRHHIAHYYDTGNGGIEHTLLAELGLVRPGGVVFGADSHTCTAGAFNASGMGFGSTDLAAVLALGELWVRVPDAIRVDLTGAPGPFVTGKDCRRPRKSTARRYARGCLKFSPKLARPSPSQPVVPASADRDCPCSTSMNGWPSPTWPSKQERKPVSWKPTSKLRHLSRSGARPP